MARVSLLGLLALVALSSAFAPAPRARAPASARAMIARGPKTEDESCAIRNAGLTPSKTPVLFGGGRTMTEEEVFKTWIGHIIPLVIPAALIIPRVDFTQFQ